MRIAITKEAFNRKISLLTSKLNIEFKKKLVKCYKIGDLNSNCQLPKSGDRKNFNTHKTCRKCCYNNERLQDRNNLLLDGRTMESKGKLIHFVVPPEIY